MYRIIASMILSLIFINPGLAANDILTCPSAQSPTVENDKRVKMEMPLGLNIDKNPSEIVMPIVPDKKDESVKGQWKNSEGEKRLKIGDHYQLPEIHPDKWRVISEVPGKFSIRIVIHAANAKMIRVHFRKTPPVEGTKIFVYGEDKETVDVLNSKQLKAYGYWSPPISGEYYYIECQYSDRASMRRPLLDKISVIDIDASLGMEKVGTCHNDITCRSENIKWIGSAVALIIYEDGLPYACTGALLNDLDLNTVIPWFLTANHCGITNDVAPTAAFYFRYQTPTCNGVPPAYYNTPRMLGAEHIVSYAGSDFTLLKLAGVPANTATLGWTTASQTLGNQTYGIHHPQGGLEEGHPELSFKRISDGEIINYISYGWPDSTHLTVQWSSGVTEPGSSGSPLLIGGQVIGQLHGGPSYCYAPANQLHDYYGRFSVSWNHGLSTYLAPSQPPSIATAPSPGNGAAGVSIYDDLNWVNGGGATSYDVYFGTDSTPDSTEYKGNQTSTMYDPGALAYSTTYYWRIDARNSTGVTAGNVWSFTTRSQPSTFSLPYLLWLLDND